MTSQAQPTIVSGSVSTVADLDKDESWLQSWLQEDPARLGLGELKIADDDPVQDEDGNPAFLATDDERYFSVDVQLGEVDASHGFQVLDNWARNRVRHPDKTHVAVLVTETAGDRYRTTLETLAEHLPLVVVELAVWRGDTEAIIVPRVALASDDVGLSLAPAVAAAAAAKSDVREVAEAESEETPASETESVVSEADTFEANDVDENESEDPDTGVDDPWKLPKTDDTLTPSESDSLAGLSSK
ncbi:MAG: hypothetical protein ACC726_01470 [Chloroflexota bacterium]